MPDQKRTHRRKRTAEKTERAQTRGEPANAPPREEVVSDTRRLPIADGGHGPLDSSDIEWLIQQGLAWIPGR